MDGDRAGETEGEVSMTIDQHRDILLTTCRHILDAGGSPAASVVALDDDGNWLGYAIVPSTDEGHDWLSVGRWAYAAGATSVLLCADVFLSTTEADVRPSEDPSAGEAVSVLHVNGVQILASWVMPYGRADDGSPWFESVRVASIWRSGPASVLAECLRGERAVLR